MESLTPFLKNHKFFVSALETNHILPPVEEITNSFILSYFSKSQGKILLLKRGAKYLPGTQDPKSKKWSFDQMTATGVCGAFASGKQWLNAINLNFLFGCYHPNPSQYVPAFDFSTPRFGPEYYCELLSAATFGIFFEMIAGISAVIKMVDEIEVVKKSLDYQADPETLQTLKEFIDLAKISKKETTKKTRTRIPPTAKLTQTRKSVKVTIFEFFLLVVQELKGKGKNRFWAFYMQLLIQPVVEAKMEKIRIKVDTVVYDLLVPKKDGSSEFDALYAITEEFGSSIITSIEEHIDKANADVLRNFIVD